MNERIKELMEQASSNACYDEPNQLHLMNDEIEKFAEMIVRECASIYSKIDNGNDHLGTADYLEALHRTFFGAGEYKTTKPQNKCSVCGTTENVTYMGGHQPYLCDSPGCIPF